MTSKNAQTGVLCLETIWFDEVDNPSTRHLLMLLKSLSGIQYVYRGMCTAKELKFHMGRWVGRNVLKNHYVLGDYGILYLGFHGSPGHIWLNEADEDGVNLDEVANYLLEDAQYDCSGCVIHFSGCSVLRAHARVREFKDTVGAAGVSGYTKEVDSIHSWAFELMYLNLLAERSTWSSGTLGTLSRRIRQNPETAGLAERLGFQIVS